MFIPIGDENPTERTPYVNYALIAGNVAAFLVFCLGPLDDPGFIRWTVVPADLQWPSLFTSMFLHAGWAHLIGNMVFLWIFGDNIEDRLGHVGYVVFYLVSGLAADAAHILSNPGSHLPTVGASGAISGVMGAYIVLYPHAKVKTFVWLGIWFADVIRTPAYLWIGLWFAQQILLNMIERRPALQPGGEEGGGVAYLAHIGGFVAGAAIAGATKVLTGVWPSSRRTEHRLDARPQEARRPFFAVQEDPGIDYIEEADERYSVLRLTDDPQDIGRISGIAASVTGESAFDLTHRLEATRGMIVRAVPRDQAQRLQRELQTQGIPSAIIVHNRSNFPPEPALVEGVSWDDRAVRFRVREQILAVPWSAPFLYVGARSDRGAFIDLFVNRKTAFRIADTRSVPLTEVDPNSRTEISTDFAGLARAILEKNAGASVNEGVSLAANHEYWGRLHFRTDSDYDDYLFWLYNLILAQAPRS